MSEENQLSEGLHRKQLTEGLAGYAIFSILSIGSRLYPLLWLFVVAFGIIFPLAWSKFVHEKLIVGGIRENMWKAMAWGICLGFVFLIYCLLSPGAWDSFPPPFFELQVIVGTIMFALVLSPFQELFFRRWLQPRFDYLCGGAGSIVITSALFMMWHWMPPFSMGLGITVDVISLTGSLSTFLLGLLCGLAYYKTNRFIAPWLAHILAGMAAIITGQIVIVQVIE